MSPGPRPFGAGVVFRAFTLPPEFSFSPRDLHFMPGAKVLLKLLRQNAPKGPRRRVPCESCDESKDWRR
jgi:hypothetical protein